MSRNVSVVIPLYNEMGQLQKAVPDFIKYIEKNFSDSEIILVENGSIDGSSERVDQLAQAHRIVRAIHLPKASYGRAFRAGLLATKKTYVIKLDADWLNIKFIEEALPLLSEFAIIAGSKSLNPVSDKRPWWRKAGSKLLTVVLNQFYGYSGGDSRGLKAFRREEMLALLNESITVEIIESEMMLLAFRAGIPATEIPVAIKEIRPPRISFLRRCLMVVRELVQLYAAIKSTKKITKRGLHADDAGLNLTVNATIEDLLRKGLLQSVSLIVNRLHSADAAKIIKKYPHVTVFFHFNLTKGRPETAPKSIPSLVNEKGQFAAARQKFVWRCLSGEVQASDVETELKAQWQKMNKLGIKAQGMDSEQHIHSLEPVASVMQTFARRNRLKIIRNYGQMKTVTLGGAFRFRLLKLAAFLTSVRYNHRFELPVTWRGQTWKPFVVASWEPINLKKVLPDTTITIHPKAGYDEDITPKIEL